MQSITELNSGEIMSVSGGCLGGDLFCRVKYEYLPPCMLVTGCIALAGAGIAALGGYFLVSAAKEGTDPPAGWFAAVGIGGLSALFGGIGFSLLTIKCIGHAMCPECWENTCDARAADYVLLQI